MGVPVNNDIVGAIVGLVVLATSVWVFFDATDYRVRTSKNIGTTAPVAWFGGCLLMWIIFFPGYLVQRNKVLLEPAATPFRTFSDSMDCPFCSERIKRNAVICRFCQRELRTRSADARLKCAECHSDVADGAKHCTKCGAKLSSSQNRLAMDAANDTADDLAAAITAAEFSTAVSLLPPNQQGAYQTELERRKKHTGLAYLYFVLLGGFGAHKFYLNEPQWGVLYLCCTLIGGGLGWMLVLAAAGANQESATFVAFIISLVAALTVLAGLIFDIFCIPRQVAASTDRIRREILASIARRLYPDVWLQPVGSVSGWSYAFVAVTIFSLVSGATCWPVMRQLTSDVGATNNNSAPSSTRTSAQPPNANSRRIENEHVRALFITNQKYLDSLQNHAVDTGAECVFIQDAPVATDALSYAALTNAGLANDRAGIEDLEHAGTAFLLSKNTKALNLGLTTAGDGITGVYHIRILSGPHARKTVYSSPIPIRAVNDNTAIANALPPPPVQATRALTSSRTDEEDSEPMKLVRELYTSWKGLTPNCWQDGRLRAYFDEDFLRLLEADIREADKRGEPARIDWDPVRATNGEFEGTSVSVRRERVINDNKVTVDAILDRGASESSTVTYTLLKRSTGWRIQDIANEGSSIRNLLLAVGE